MTKPTNAHKKINWHLYQTPSVDIIYPYYYCFGFRYHWLHNELTVAKSAAIGALLSFAHASQVFAFFVLVYAGYRARQHIVSQLVEVKWPNGY